MKQLIARAAMAALTAAFIAAASAWTISDLLQDAGNGNAASATSAERPASSQ